MGNHPPPCYIGADPPPRQELLVSHTSKAYKNLEFLNSPHARTIRMLCEYEEPRARFRDQEVKDTIVIFGSARIRSAEVSQQLLDAAVAAGDPIATERGKQAVRSARFYEDTRELSRRLTAWSMSLRRPKAPQRFLVCTGGGPGIMEAANRGAADVEGGRSVGLGISLPFEEQVNQWVEPELAFEFHYFFMRKYWFMYLAKALVIMPGGFGTLDEMCEVLTLRQTRKVTKPLPMVLYGTDYWDAVLDVEAMIEWGTVAPGDRQLMHRSNSVDDTFDFLTNALDPDKERA
ncbi:MAG: LOG family protein [Myxococcales bacterium]|nr:LOG family protein [Myxococcales bacterium]